MRRDKTARPARSLQGKWLAPCLVGEPSGRSRWGAVYRATDLTDGKNVEVHVLEEEGARRCARALARVSRQALSKYLAPVRWVARAERNGIDYAVVELGAVVESGAVVEMGVAARGGASVDDDGLDVEARKTALEVVATSGPLSVTSAGKVLARLLRAMSHVHAAGGGGLGVHPGRVFLDGDVPRLQPFRDIKDEVLAARYLPPESAETAAGDVYGLAALYHWLVTGQHAREGETLEEVRAAAREPFPAFAELPGLSGRVADVLQKATSLHPENRPADAGAMLAAIKPPAPAPVAPPPAPKPFPVPLPPPAPPPTPASLVQEPLLEPEPQPVPVNVSAPRRAPRSRRAAPRRGGWRTPLVLVFGVGLVVASLAYWRSTDRATGERDSAERAARDARTTLGAFLERESDALQSVNGSLKRALSRIDEAIDSGDFETARKACERMTAELPELVEYLEKLEGDRKRRREKKPRREPRRVNPFEPDERTRRARIAAEEREAKRQSGALKAWHEAQLEMTNAKRAWKKLEAGESATSGRAREHEARARAAAKRVQFDDARKEANRAQSAYRDAIGEVRARSAKADKDAWGRAATEMKAARAAWERIRYETDWPAHAAGEAETLRGNALRRADLRAWNAAAEAADDATAAFRKLVVAAWSKFEERKKQAEAKRARIRSLLDDLDEQVDQQPSTDRELARRVYSENGRARLRGLLLDAGQALREGHVNDAHRLMDKVDADVRTARTLFVRLQKAVDDAEAAANRVDRRNEFDELAIERYHAAARKIVARGSVGAGTRYLKAADSARSASDEYEKCKRDLQKLESRIRASMAKKIERVVREARDSDRKLARAARLLNTLRSTIARKAKTTRVVPERIRPDRRTPPRDRTKKPEPAAQEPGAYELLKNAKPNTQVILPPGTHDFPKPVTVTDLRIKGSGRGKKQTRLRFASGARLVLVGRVAKVTGVVFEAIDKRKARGVPGEAGSLLALRTKDAEVRICTFINASGCAIVIAGGTVQTARIDGCVVTGAGQHGLYVIGVSSVRIDGGTFEKCGLAGIAVIGKQDVTIDRARCQGNQHGILLQGRGATIYLRQNHCNENLSTGIRLEGKGRVKEMKDNIIRDNTRYGVQRFRRFNVPWGHKDKNTVVNNGDRRGDNWDRENALND